eukprot:Awhi_evm1s14461
MKLSNSNTEDCGICLEKITFFDNVIKTPCDHRFHRECFKIMALSTAYTTPGPKKRKNSNCCPLCRTSVDNMKVTDLQ